MLSFNPIALRKVKIIYNFGLSECNRAKCITHFGRAVSNREGNMKSQKLLHLVRKEVNPIIPTVKPE